MSACDPFSCMVETQMKSMDRCIIEYSLSSPLSEEECFKISYACSRIHNPTDVMLNTVFDRLMVPKRLQRDARVQWRKWSWKNHWVSSDPVTWR